MSRRIIRVGLDDDLGAVRALFERFRFHHVMVVDGGRLAGVVSDRDLLKHMSPFVGAYSERPQDAKTLRTRVHQVMTRKPVTATTEATVQEVAALMLDERVSCVPIVSHDGHVVGVVTTRDLLRVVRAASQDSVPEARFS